MTSNPLRLFIILTLVLIFFLSFTASAQNNKGQTTAKTSIENRFQWVSNHLSGPGKGSSFLMPGLHYNEEIDISDERKLYKKVDSRIELSIRSTDNVQIDDKNFSFEKARWNLKFDKNELNFGDHFALLSQYTMNKSIKGFGYQHNFKDEQNYFRATFGSFDNQWEYWYENPGPGEQEPMNRFGGGVRIQKSGKNYRLGFNLAYVDDDQGDPHRTTETAYRQEIGAVDWEYRAEFKDFRFRLKGEHAYSYTDGQTTADVISRKNGQANKLTLKGGGLWGLGVLGKFEKVSPEFSTLGGGATPDRLRYYLKLTRKFDKVWQVHGSYNYSHNKLSRSMTGTRTDNRTYDMGLRRTKAFNRRRMRIDFNLRHKTSYSENRQRDTITDRIKLGVSDRIFKNIRYRASLAKTIRENDVAITKQDNLLYSINLSSRHRLGKWTVRPHAYFSRQGAENLNDWGINTTTSYRMGFLANKSLHRFGADINLVHTNITVGTDSVNSRWNAYYERKLSPFEIIGIKVKNAVLKADIKYNKYNFFDDSLGQDYEERVIMFMLRFNL